MQSLYKVIKNTSVVEDGEKEIVTDFQSKNVIQQKELGEINAKMFIDSYEELARTMVENARRQSDEFLSKAFTESERMGKEAYEKGYNEGKQTGYNDGFNKAYEEGYQKNFDKATAEGEAIKNNADNVLKNSIEEKERYFKEKEEEIKNLIVNCVEAVLKREVKDEDGLNSVIFQALSKVKNTKTFIIKSNKIYCDELKNKVELWKEQLPFKGDMFIIPDESMEQGKAVIEIDNGKIELSIEDAVEKIKEIVFNGE